MQNDLDKFMELKSSREKHVTFGEAIQPLLVVLALILIAVSPAIVIAVWKAAL